MAVYRCLSLAACRVVAKHQLLQGAFIRMKLVCIYRLEFPIIDPALTGGKIHVEDLQKFSAGAGGAG